MTFAPYQAVLSISYSSSLVGLLFELLITQQIFKH
jgi:hypothetical protein